MKSYNPDIYRGRKNNINNNDISNAKDQEERVLLISERLKKDAKKLHRGRDASSWLPLQEQIGRDFNRPIKKSYNDILGHIKYSIAENELNDNRDNNNEDNLDTNINNNKENHFKYPRWLKREIIIENDEDNNQNNTTNNKDDDEDEEEEEYEDIIDSLYENDNTPTIPFDIWARRLDAKKKFEKKLKIKEIEILKRNEEQKKKKSEEAFRVWREKYDDKLEEIKLKELQEKREIEEKNRNALQQQQNKTAWSYEKPWRLTKEELIEKRNKEKEKNRLIEIENEKKKKEKKKRRKEFEKHFETWRKMKKAEDLQKKRYIEIEEKIQKIIRKEEIKKKWGKKDFVCAYTYAANLKKEENKKVSNKKINLVFNSSLSRTPGTLLKLG